MRYRRVAHVAWRKVGKETVVIDLRGRRVYGLNEPAGVVWHALEEFADAGALSALLAVGDGAMPDPGRREDAVRTFLGELTGLGLVASDTTDSGVASGQPHLEAPIPAGAPAITWTDEVRAFGGSCNFFPGGGGCDNNPTS
ncbi:MAG: PqqD family protein [Acidobacteriia bacterium]|nr:PqqD family protein [Terriglobia bacterium]